MHCSLIYLSFLAFVALETVVIFYLLKLLEAI